MFVFNGYLRVYNCDRVSEFEVFYYQGNKGNVGTRWKQIEEVSQ